MEISGTQLKEMHELELNALASFIDVCKKMNLKYYLLGGTMLGAIRHQGFIPWDDDIDVGMPREDYEIFTSEGQKYFSKDYFIQTHITDPEYILNFAKIRINNTAYIETSIASRKINHGIYIDVFPLDIYPDNDKYFYFKKRILDIRVSAAYEGINYSNKVRACQALSHILYPTLKGAVRAKERHMKSVKKGKKIANLCGAWGKKEIVPACWYGEGAVKKFEGLDVIVPSEYDLWLSQVYGNYMELPPEDKRKSHHYVNVIDTTRSYIDYVERKI